MRLAKDHLMMAPVEILGVTIVDRLMFVGACCPFALLLCQSNIEMLYGFRLRSSSAHWFSGSFQGRVLFGVWATSFLLPVSFIMP